MVYLAALEPELSVSTEGHSRRDLAVNLSDVTTGGGRGQPWTTCEPSRCCPCRRLWRGGGTDGLDRWAAAAERMQREEGQTVAVRGFKLTWSLFIHHLTSSDRSPASLHSCDSPHHSHLGSVSWNSDVFQPVSYKCAPRGSLCRAKLRCRDSGKRGLSK